MFFGSVSRVKRLVISLIAIAVASVLLTGCAQKDQNQTSTEDTSPLMTDVQSATAEPFVSSAVTQTPEQSVTSEENSLKKLDQDSQAVDKGLNDKAIEID